MFCTYVFVMSKFHKEAPLELNEAIFLILFLYLSSTYLRVKQARLWYFMSSVRCLRLLYLFPEKIIEELKHRLALVSNQFAILIFPLSTVSLEPDQLICEPDTSLIGKDLRDDEDEQIYRIHSVY